MKLTLPPDPSTVVCQVYYNRGEEESPDTLPSHWPPLSLHLEKQIVEITMTYPIHPTLK